MKNENKLLKHNQKLKLKEDKKFLSNTKIPQIEFPSKLIDKNYLKMIINKKADFEDYEPEPHVEVGNSKIFVIAKKKSSAETFSLADKKLSEFKFLLADNMKNINMKGALSLGHEYDSKHKSLVYEMSHFCIIFYNMFLFQFEENDEKQLLIGDITKDQKRKYQYINKCLFLKEVLPKSN